MLEVGKNITAQVLLRSPKRHPIWQGRSVLARKSTRGRGACECISSEMQFEL
jgi:hypothetical protein